MSKKSPQKRATSASKNKVSVQATTKEPVYKKWWFWVIIILVLAAIGGVSSNKNNGELVSTGNTQTSNSDEKKEYAVGDTVSINQREFTITNVERNFLTGNEFVDPDEGKEYIKVTVKIANKTNSKIRYSDYDMELVDTNGVVINPSAFASAQLGDYLSSGELMADGTKTGSTLFEVAAGEQGLKLHYKPSYWSNKEAVFNL